jgi:uncharacterized protein DUF748
MRKTNDRGGFVHVGRPRRSPARKHRWRRIALWGLAVLVVLSICVRPMLPWVVRRYINQTLNHNLIYAGRIGDVSLHLWRGAYTITDIRIFKRTGDVPEPLFSAREMDLAIQWNALLNHKLVGQVVFEEPQINFVAPSDDSESQTGAGEPWMGTLQSLFPFQINRAEIHHGSLHFRSYVRATPVDVYLANLQASVEDLTNVRSETTPLMATVSATAMAMDQAPFEFHMKLNPFAYRPTFEMTARLLGLDVTKLNDLSHTYGRFEFKRGWFDLVVAAKAEQGQIDGYVKPLFRNLQLFDPSQDLKTDEDPLQFFWQAVLGAVVQVFKNPPRDQFGTSISFTGDLTQPDTDFLSAVGNVLRNAFIRAYLPQLNNGTEEYDGMEFQPGSITDSTSIGDEP